MNEDTRNLLKECTAGCKMAIGSMRQVESVIRDSKLENIITSYKDKHEELERTAQNYLEQAGDDAKEPNPMASAMSWISTEVKLFMEDDSHKIAKLMMDGCNMGIQSVSEYQNQYTHASDEAKDIAKNLVKIEEDFMKEMKQFV